MNTVLARDVIGDTMSKDMGWEEQRHGALCPAEAQNSWKAISPTSPGGGFDCGQILQGQWKFFPPTSTPKKPSQEVAWWPGAQAQIHRTLASIPVLLLIG